MTSHPSWVCGLKLMVLLSVGIYYWVTPFVGVWIETLILSRSSFTLKVTPFVGVWIETTSQRYEIVLNRSHTLRGCVD